MDLYFCRLIVLRFRENQNANYFSFRCWCLYKRSHCLLHNENQRSDTLAAVPSDSNHGRFRVVKIFTLLTAALLTRRGPGAQPG